MLRAKVFSSHVVEGEALVVDVLSFLGDVDPETGTIVAKDSGAYGEKVCNKILVIKRCRGSTVGPYILYALSRKGLAPKAIVLGDRDPVVIAGAVLSDIPLAIVIDRELLTYVHSGCRIVVDPHRQCIEVICYSER